MRNAFKVFIVFTTLILFLMFFLLYNLNKVVEKTITTYGTSITNTNLRVEEAKLSFDGTGELISLSIANPKGYSKNELFKVNNLRVAVDFKSIFTEKIIIKYIKIKKPIIRLEMKKNGKTNIETIIKNIEGFTYKLNRNEAESNKKDINDKKLLLEELSIQDSTLEIKIPKIDQIITIGLSPIYLKNIGITENGITSEELLKIIFQSVNQQILKENKNTLLDFKEKVKKSKNKIKKIEKDAKEKLNEQINKFF